MQQSERTGEPKKDQALAAILMKFDRRVAQVKKELTVDARTAAAFDRAAARVDRARYETLQRYIEDESDVLMPLPGFKYVDLPWYLLQKARWITALDLDVRPPERILDLGAGAGHFPFLAQSHGHSVVGIDMANDLYTKVLDLYGVQRLVQMIVPGAPLPECGKFDLVTAFQTTFNRPVGRGKLGRNDTYWRVDEWAWFFDQLSDRLNYPGRIFFELNHQPIPETGGDHAETLMDLFERNGAVVQRRQCTVMFTLNAPLKLQG